MLAKKTSAARGYWRAVSSSSTPPIVLDVPRPDPAGADREQNDYVFERAVRPRGSELTKTPKRIDLYNRNRFILEAKQSRLPGKKNAIPGQLPIPTDEPEQLGRRSITRDWDVMMQNARGQAEGYVFLLDVDHAAPPFIIACDVGHCLELYADFTGTGRAYNQFPDRKGFLSFYVRDGYCCINGITTHVSMSITKLLALFQTYYDGCGRRVAKFDFFTRLETAVKL
jgi:hypothetical protein